jgi:hypothetical protein
MEPRLQLYKVKLLYSGIFAIAMAYLESAVVVYLRLLYSPDGIIIPLTAPPDHVLWTEIGREVATIVMLLFVSRMAARTRREWFGYFAYNFGIWDIWYYIWLKILLGWPQSLLDWDVLFLIPVVWTGPVLAPVLVSFCLILAGVLVIKHPSLKLTRTDWILEYSAGTVIILSFLTPVPGLELTSFPESYPWPVFISGMALGLLVFFNRLRLHLKLNR